MAKILLEVHYITKPGKRDDFYRDVQGPAKMSRDEAGNEMYEYYFNPENENELLLIEKWQDDNILEAHWNAPHFAAISALKDKYVDDVIVNKFYIL